MTIKVPFNQIRASESAMSFCDAYAAGERRMARRIGELSYIAVSQFN